MQTENDLCPGYQSNHTGHSGLCCCGLYWQGVMPPHDVKGHKVHMDRIMRRSRANAEEEARRRKEREAYGRNDVCLPVAPGRRMRAWRDD